jgi:hypothetical protein
MEEGRKEKVTAFSILLFTEYAAVKLICESKML